jgi:hypothetical protein
MIRTAQTKEDRLSRRVIHLAERSRPNVACVALANKTVRMAWAMLRHDCEATLHDGKPVEPALAKPFNVHVRQARQSDWELTRE